MDTHKNARLTPKGREEMMRAVVNGVQSYAAAARKFNTTPKTVAKWVKCFRAEGVDGLCNHSQDLFIGQPNFASHMRRHRGLAPTALHREAHCSRSWRLAATVCRVLKRRGLNKLSALEAAELSGSLLPSGPAPSLHPALHAQDQW